MHLTFRRVLATASAAAVAAGVLAGCGGDESADGPVTLEYWGWAAGLEIVVQKFNDTHDDITINYTKINGGNEGNQNLRNAVAAGNGPCLQQGNAQELTSYVADGIVQNVDEHLSAYKADYSASAYDMTTVAGEAWAIPQSGSTQFMIYNMEVMDEYGQAVPKTWEEYIEVGKVLAKEGIRMTNMAGEDPSTLVTLAWQAGAKWYQIEGDAWKIDFLSPESLEAADVIQQQIDNDEIVSISYADYASVLQSFDSGETITRPLSTWQLAGMEKNMENTLGNWKPAPTPTFGTDPLANPGWADMLTVPTGCEHVEQAVEAAHWITTSADSVNVMSDPATGAAFFPSVADPEPYVDILIPEKVMGDYKADAKQVILDGATSTVQGWKYGVNYTAMYEELADGWAKVVTKEQTVRQLLEHIQTWTVEDLRSRGVNVIG